MLYAHLAGDQVNFTDNLETQEVDIMTAPAPTPSPIPSASPVLSTQQLRQQYQGKNDNVSRTLQYGSVPPDQDQDGQELKCEKTGDEEEHAGHGDAGQKGGEEGEYPVKLLTRNDQLSMKKSKKDARKNKMAENKRAKGGAPKKGKKVKKGKTGKKKKGKKALKNKKPKSPSRRKLRNLQAAGASASSAAAAEDAGAKRRKKVKKSKEPGVVLNEVDAEETWVDPQEACESAAGRKSKTKGKGKSPKKAPKPKAEAKAKAKASAKAKSKGRRRRGDADGDQSDARFSDPRLAQFFIDFAKSVGGSGIKTTSPKYKSSVRAGLADLKECAYNMYWTKCSCGLRIQNAYDAFYFSFVTSSAENSYKMAVAAKCCEICAT